MLLPVTIILSLVMVPDCPDEVIAIDGVAPASPILLLVMVLLSLPVVPVLLEKRMVPETTVVAAVPAPSTVQLVIVLPLASLIKRIVEVPAVLPVPVFEMVSEFPPVFKPSNTTLSAPLRSIIATPAAIAPEIVLPPAGVMVTPV